MKNKILNALIEKSGINYAVVFSVLGRIVQGGGGLLSIYFVLKYLNKFEQGYFYTFGSILALQVFFELGLTSIITQFTAHEFAKLSIKNETLLTGNEENLSRISSLLHVSVKWFVILGICLIIVLTLVGYIFFNFYNSAQTKVDWFFPWIILTTTSGLNLMFTPILSFLEGLGKIKEVALIRVIQYSLQTLFVLVFLSLDFKLYSSPIANFFSLLVVPVFIFFSYRKKLLLNIWSQLGSSRISYKKEIFPFQWKISLSWISGYFIYQLFNPIVFASEGAVVAGQMGLSLAVFNGIQSVSLSWLNTKIPIFSVFIANKEFSKLDVSFKKTSIASTVVTIAGTIFFLIGLLVASKFNLDIKNRFLPFILLVILGISMIINQYIAGLAIYLRCHKKEPLLRFSIGIAILIALGIAIAGKFSGVFGVVVWYSIVIIFISLPWAQIIFNKKRKIWHHEDFEKLGYE